MSKAESAIIHVAPLRPAVVSISDARRYLGNISRSKFYADVLPQLDVVKIGSRTLPTVESLERLVAANLRAAVE